MDAAETLDGGRRDLLLVCDHASNRVPAEFDGLGLDDAALASHIGWDIGAGALTRRLSALLDAPALLCRFSRLIVDPNRALDHPQAIPAESGGVRVPGNEGLAPAERERRAARFHRPWHAAVAAAVDAMAAPAVVAVHSFTPVLDAGERPWHAAVLHDDDERLARLLLRALRRRGGLHIGDNEPYTGYSDLTFTLPWHAGRRGLRSAAIEVRQNLLASPAGVERWARILAAALRDSLGEAPA